MVQNLRLVNKTISASDSNLAPGKTVAIPAHTSSFCGDFDCANTLQVYDTGNNTNGAYYNWYTATGTNGVYPYSSSVSSHDICPKGWRLPTGASGGEFEQLNAKYTSQTSMFGAPGYTFSGFIVGSSIESGQARFWSNTAVSWAAYGLHLAPSTVLPANGYNFYMGFAIRCLAK